MDFPNSPSLGQTYSINGVTWTYNGYAWDKVPSGATASTITQLLGFTPYNPGTATVVTNSNIGTYAPSKTGAGASGNWDINITGTAGSVSWTNVTSKPTYATVATSGSYTDLTNKPTIPDLSNYATTSQLALKAPLDNPAFTGDLTLTSGVVSIYNMPYIGLSVVGSSYYYSYQFQGNSSIGLAADANLIFYSSDFTIEFWLKAPSSQTAYAMIMDSTTNNTGTGIGLGANVNGTAGKLSFYAQGGTSPTLNTTTTMTDNVWRHVACVKSGSNGYIFVNGILEASSSSWGTVTNATLASGLIGRSRYGSGTNSDNTFTGYLSNLRIVKGTALYTSNFSVPTNTLTAITGTSLLTAQSPKLVDNSGLPNMISYFTSVTTNASGPTLSGVDVGSSWLYDGNGAWVADRNVKVKGNLTVSGNTTFTGTVSGLSISASSVGLGNVTNESKATMFTSPTFTGTVSGITATMVGLGNVTNESKATMFTSPTFTGTVNAATATFTNTVTMQQSTELLNVITGATGVVVHSYLTGAIFYHSSIAANFTVNFTNVPTTDNRTIVCTLILAQGATPYIPNAVQIAGTAQTIKWFGGSAPTGTANRVEVVSFTLIRATTWTVLGSLSSYG